VLHTTETVSGGINGNIQKVFEDVNQAFEQNNGQAAGRNRARIKRQINNSSGQRQQRLITCVQNSGQDVARMQRCVNRFSP
jgi:hypothetical protein